MKANRSADTQPEVRVRSALHRLGYRFRKNYAIVTPDRRARADIVFTRDRVAVFIDGCFWHGCPEHGHLPRANTHYWEPKLERNVRRDRAVDVALGEAGWRIVRLYEHVPVEDAVQEIVAAVEAERGRR